MGVVETLDRQLSRVPVKALRPGPLFDRMTAISKLTGRLVGAKTCESNAWTLARAAAELDPARPAKVVAGFAFPPAEGRDGKDEVAAHCWACVGGVHIDPSWTRWHWPIERLPYWPVKLVDVDAKQEFDPKAKFDPYLVSAIAAYALEVGVRVIAE